MTVAENCLFVLQRPVVMSAVDVFYTVLRLLVKFQCCGTAGLSPLLIGWLHIGRPGPLRASLGPGGTTVTHGAPCRLPYP